MYVFYLLFLQIISLSLIPTFIYTSKKNLYTQPDGATTPKIIERRCGETRVIVVRADDERAERVHFPASGWGQKRFRRSTKQQERRERGPRAVRKTTSPRSVRCVMREKLRARQPGGTCVLRKFLRSTPVDIVKHCLVLSRENLGER